MVPLLVTLVAGSHSPAARRRTLTLAAALVALAAAVAAVLVVGARLLGGGQAAAVPRVVAAPPPAQVALAAAIRRTRASGTARFTAHLAGGSVEVRGVTSLTDDEAVMETVSAAGDVLAVTRAKDGRAEVRAPPSAAPVVVPTAGVGAVDRGWGPFLAALDRAGGDRTDVALDAEGRIVRVRLPTLDVTFDDFGVAMPP